MLLYVIFCFKLSRYIIYFESYVSTVNLLYMQEFFKFRLREDPLSILTLLIFNHEKQTVVKFEPVVQGVNRYIYKSNVLGK